MQRSNILRAKGISSFIYFACERREQEKEENGFPGIAVLNISCTSARMLIPLCDKRFRRILSDESSGDRFYPGLVFVAGVDRK